MVLLGVFAFAWGASVGSFLNVVADRLPAGNSIVSPRSFCDGCRRSLASRHMVPIFSYLWLRGRCRYCGAAIPARVLVVEIICGLVFTLVYLKYDLGLDFIIVCVAASLMLVVGIIDLEHRLILNRVVFPSLVVLIVLAPFWPEIGIARPLLGSDNMLASLNNSLLAGVGSFLVFLLILVAYPQGMGGGDVKLAGVVGLLVGFPVILVAMWLSIASAGLVAISLLLLRLRGRKDAIPFGPFISLGTIVALLVGADIVSYYEDLRATGLGFWL